MYKIKTRVYPLIVTIIIWTSIFQKNNFMDLNKYNEGKKNNNIQYN